VIEAWARPDVRGGEANGHGFAMPNPVVAMISAFLSFHRTRIYPGCDELSRGEVKSLGLCGERKQMLPALCII